MTKIFIAGSSNMDLVFTYNVFPQPGETIFGKEFLINEGGKGLNQAVACARQDVSVSMVSSVGNDGYGEKLISVLKENHIDTSHVIIREQAHSGIALILVNASDNRIIVNSGANSLTTYDQVVKALDEASPGDVFLTQFEIPFEVVESSLSYAKTKKMITIVNPAPGRKIDSKTLKNIDILIPNETEAESITGIKYSDDNSSKKMIQYLINNGVKEVIITLGDKGSIYGNSESITRIPSFCVNVVDTTAAGDTFVATIAANIVKGHSTSDSLLKATAASALAVSKLGAMVSIPTNGEIEAFLTNHKIIGLR
ncbi:MAG: ribokinase [Candidatus Izemoplasmatales bacterium]|jgi:ribokinase|nr:ribokinase [Candidatus Izemoplasmatales bacterium]